MTGDQHQAGFAGGFNAIMPMGNQAHTQETAQ